MRLSLRIAFVALLGTLCWAHVACAQAVKISQVFGGGGNPGAPFNRDYIELFNAGVMQVNLAGWSLQYATAAGTTWQSTPLPTRTLAAGGYFLVQMSSVGTVGEPLPQPDHSANPGIAMTSSSGKVALVSNTTALSGACPSGPHIVDFVGFGVSASCFEGAGSAPAPSNTSVILRGSNGCSDTGSNSADFFVGSALPRNSAIAGALCPGADLSLSIVPDSAQLTMEVAGGFTVRVSNLGPDPATGVALTITLPTNAALASSTPEAIPIDGLLVVPLGELAPDQEGVVSLSLVPYAGTQLSLTASAVSPVPDPKPGNSSVTVSPPVFSFARAKLFVGVKDPAADLRAVDVDSGASKAIISASVSGLAADNENRRFFISDGENLSVVPWDTLTPKPVGRITGADGNIDGLAWHPSRRRLLGTSTASIYEIDLQTAVASRIRLLPGGDFGGIDYDITSNRLIAANNSASTAGGLSGRGFYRIHPYGTELAFLAAFPERSPGVPETDVDGCAVGGGRYFGVTDQTESIYRYQQNTSSYLTPFLQPLTADHGESGSTYASEFYSQSPGANLGVQISGPADCAAIDGLPLSFDVTLRNFGPAYAVSPLLTVTLPTTATFVEAVPAITIAANVLSLPIAGLGAGESQSVHITISPGAGPLHTMSASCSSTTADALPLNNTATRDFLTQSALPAAPAATAVLSTLAGSNVVPAHDGVVLSPGTDLGRVFRSPSGNRWLIAASMTTNPSRDRVLLRGSAASFEVVAQEGVTTPPEYGVAIGDFSPVYSILDNGDLAYATDYDPDPTFGLIVVRSIGGALSVVAEQGAGSVPIGSTYGAGLGSITLQGDGTVSFHASLVSGASTTHALLTADGQTILAQTQVTIPIGQLSAPVPLEALASGATDAQVSWVNAAGNRWCTRADLSGPAATDICLVVDGAVRIQEGFRIPGSTLTSNVAAIQTVDMDPLTGDVCSRGSNADGKDWVWRNGQVVASTGAIIHPGTSERFADNLFARCFWLATGGPSGDMVVGGTTDAADVNANEVIVLNNQRVLLRENDPIDIDGDGLLDDDARIHAFREGSAFLSADGWLYAVVRVRSSSSVCQGSPVETGQALVRVRVLCQADFNRDGAANVPDIFAFLSSWFAGSPVADVDGVDGVAVPDIFAFLSLWFGGC